MITHLTPERTIHDMDPVPCQVSVTTSTNLLISILLLLQQPNLIAVAEISVSFLFTTAGANSC